LVSSGKANPELDEPDTDPRSIGTSLFPTPADTVAPVKLNFAHSEPTQSVRALVPSPVHVAKPTQPKLPCVVPETLKIRLPPGMMV
jgi:hypothetical protein